MGKQSREEDGLAVLLAAASSSVLRELILGRPEVRRQCFDFLKAQVSVSEVPEGSLEGEVVLALWFELEPDLSELDEYGGGDYATADPVADLLEQIRTQLDSKKVASDYRRELLDCVLPYIESGNAGIDDSLYDVAYAACYDDADLRRLAEAFEAMKGDWKMTHARRIYRRLGDRDRYLKLRMSCMVYGADYHDLATFYWESGEKEQALQVANEGLRNGQGRMHELRRFVADRARESGDRDRYLALEFEQAADGLTLEKYKTFQEICTAPEWAWFEPKLLALIENTWRSEQLKIHMHRKQHAEAVAILTQRRYPRLSWDDTGEIRVAEKLEKRYPEEILEYYLSGLGNLKVSASRKEYARNAQVMAKVRRVLVEVLGDEHRWVKFATKVKQDNIRRPAFQEECGIWLPDWRELDEDQSRQGKRAR